MYIYKASRNNYWSLLQFAMLNHSTGFDIPAHSNISPCSVHGHLYTIEQRSESYHWAFNELFV